MTTNLRNRLSKIESLIVPPAPLRKILLLGQPSEDACASVKASHQADLATGVAFTPSALFDIFCLTLARIAETKAWEKAGKEKL